MVQFGSIAGGVSRSGVNIRPRSQEDPGFNPRPLAESKFQFQSPFPPPGQRKYTAPAVLPGLERAAPTPDFSPQPGGDAIGAMPPVQIPGERLPMPTYQEPEAPGWKRTALGIGLSGMANLTGQGPQAAANFFLAPEARAERDYARELGAYSARQGEWSQYYEDIMGQQEHELNRQRLEELETRPHQVSRYGSLVGRGGEVLYQDPNVNLFGGGGAAWEANKMQAWNVWLQSHPEKTLGTMTPKDRQEAERDALEFRGGIPYELVYGDDGVPRRVPRYEASQYRAAATVFEDPSAVGGLAGGRPPQPRRMGLTTAQRSNMELEEQTEFGQAFDDEGRAAVRAKYDAVFVRGTAHDEGEKMPRRVAVGYVRIAKLELGDRATNDAIYALAKQWAEEDGWDHAF